MIYKITKLCECCNKPFETYIKQNYRFCSKRCAQLQQETRICEYCKQEFSCNKARSKKYCTQYCAREARKEAHRKTFICQYCGKSFTRRPSPSSTNTYQFCSPSCRNKARAIPDIPCPACGTLFKPKVIDVGNVRRKYCSRECVWLASIGKPSSKKTSQEIKDMVGEFYPTHGADFLAEKLGLTKSSIFGIAYKLGIKLNLDTFKEIVHGAAKENMTNNNPMKKDSVKKKVAQYWIDHPKEKQIVLEKLTIGKQRIQRDKPTKLEQRLFQYLTELEVIFEPYFLIKPKFIVDALVGNSLIIQVDGDYWHGHPRFKELTERQLKQQARDKAQDKYLETCGYKVIRIWESDMSKELVKTILKSNGAI